MIDFSRTEIAPFGMNRACSVGHLANGINGFWLPEGAEVDRDCRARADHTDPNLRKRRLGTPGRPPGLLRRLSDCVVGVELPSRPADGAPKSSAAKRLPDVPAPPELGFARQARRPAVRAHAVSRTSTGSNPLMPLECRAKTKKGEGPVRSGASPGSSSNEVGRRRAYLFSENLGGVSIVVGMVGGPLPTQVSDPVPAAFSRSLPGACRPVVQSRGLFRASNFDCQRTS